jgi:hypothetical protein
MVSEVEQCLFGRLGLLLEVAGDGGAVSGSWFRRLRHPYAVLLATWQASPDLRILTQNNISES